MPPQPSSRITKVSPFSNVGIDYFGPVFIKNEDSNRKAWVCLFVCMVTRALHMDLVADMTAAEFPISFQCCAARNGTPTLEESDNAPPPPPHSSRLRVISNSCLEGHSHRNPMLFYTSSRMRLCENSSSNSRLGWRLLRKTGWTSQEEHAQDDSPFIA